MYEYTLREQALRQVLGCIIEEHPDKSLALAQIDGLMIQMMIADGNSDSRLLHEIDLIRAELGWSRETVPAPLLR